ncbi:MAG: DNA repair protein RecO [Ilumatobacteraceae bacterium]
MTSKYYRDTGIVLRTYKLGEADRIIVVLTAEHGKVRAIAKGIRKTRSKFGGRLEPLSHVVLQFHRGRDLDVISQVETVSTSAAVFGDLDSMTEASTILEAIDQLVPDREPVPQMYRMLVGARQTLLTRPSPMVVPAFLWRLLSVEGLRPELSRCVSCNEEFGDVVSAGDRGLVIDVDLGGVVCRACQRGRQDADRTDGHGSWAPISSAALTVMRDLLEGRLGEVLDRAHDPAGQQVDDPVANEILVLATRAFEHHVERRLRSVSIFERR